MHDNKDQILNANDKQFKWIVNSRILFIFSQIKSLSAIAERLFIFIVTVPFK